ncbi:MAG: hypothetical protein JO236_08875 [Mycobacterium sp.]|uniref:hypothetical protein n=1 Tax=Mycobacterium sp. TaxID=1785 RepID=UPI001EC4E256|nr:hypothetical protein [Mycobacterium sp.]MBW0017641.1 hypothetical protein [Mycobacterium sp.]
MVRDIGDIGDIGPTGDVPEADAVEQHQLVVDDEAGLDTAYLSSADREANEADLIDQATTVADPDDDWDVDR